MTVVAVRKAGRPHGSKSQSTLLKARTQEAGAFLEEIMRNPQADPELRIMAASAIIGAHFDRQSSN